MINKLPALKVELEKTVLGLKPIQSFTVIFYQDNGYKIWQKQLTPATPENKQRFSTWMNDITSGGQTDPLPALELGLKFHPQLMYFLTDASDFPDVGAVQRSSAQSTPTRGLRSTRSCLWPRPKNRREIRIPNPSCTASPTITAEFSNGSGWMSCSKDRKNKRGANRKARRQVGAAPSLKKREPRRLVAGQSNLFDVRGDLNT